MTRHVVAVAVAMGLSVIHSTNVLAGVIDFEDIAVATGTEIEGGDVVSRGFLFDTDIVTASGGHSHLVNDRFSSANGTTYFATDDTQPGPSPVDRKLTMSRVDGTSFSLVSADFSEFVHFPANPLFGGSAEYIDVTGFLSGGGTVSQRVILDRIVDGPGGAADFQTALFSGWNNLLSVQFDAGGSEAFDWWALDDIDVGGTPVAVPEPGALALFGCGLGALLAGRRRRANGQR